ncbi:glycosyl transferase family protein [Candidatus Magnetoovum chiemensis]|nr:glycosyl transferase family protein [Candidatus Magnetoovum chiemensis]
MKVSIIIPTYNRADYVKEAVDSVLCQSYANKEVIVVDDGSTDNTKEALRAYIENGSIIYYYQDNSGPSAARNNGIKRSSGELIAFLDSDDIWESDKIAIQAEMFASNLSPDMVFSDYSTFDNNGIRDFNRNSAKFKDNELITFKKLYSGINFIYPSTVMIKRSVLDECSLFDETLRNPIVEDYELWLRIASMERFRIIGVRKSLTRIRLHKRDDFSEVNRKLADELKVVERYSKYADKRLYLKRKAKVFLLNADRYIYQNDFKNTVKLVLRALSIYPFVFNDLLVIAARAMLGAERTERIRRKIVNIKLLNKIYTFIYKRT